MTAKEPRPVSGETIWVPDWRITGNGHRAGPEPPVATRELPVILWPFELTGRLEARIRGRLDRTGRLPL
jgi:hypothetical protein